ncbi:MAG: hypothetical protein GY711_16020 [bacterium]|nr:hypothetical protein [bacterium]
MVCYVLPLVQVRGAFYLYDAFLVFALAVLKMPRVQARAGQRFEQAWWTLLVAVLVGFGSTAIRAGIGFKTVAYTVQYLLVLLYARSLFHNALAGRVDPVRLAGHVSIGGIVAASLGVLHGLLLLGSPELGHRFYTSYLRLAGYSSGFYERKLISHMDRTGLTRVLGTWDTSTTFAGMMALAAAWLLLCRWRASNRGMGYTVILLAALMSLSRHSWVLCSVVLIGMRTSRLWITFWIACATLLLVSGLFPGRSTGNAGVLVQVEHRIQRSIDENVRDSSIQKRYVEGTARFLRYARKDPAVLLVGFGIKTESRLLAGHEAQMEQEMARNDYYGFVSNGWLLIWRNLGILGIVGLLLMHVGLWRVRVPGVGLLVVFSALLIGSDNYPIAATRCFFLILAFLTTAWSIALRFAPVERGGEQGREQGGDAAVEARA